mmetsp:Transcript_10221/g.15553  ORF Transcript_10221/g.15553 Transcript_10221/m.15553 type:complete len:246 (+) Transcript_10221:4001-4738(+)
MNQRAGQRGEEGDRLGSVARLGHQRHLELFLLAVLVRRPNVLGGGLSPDFVGLGHLPHFSVVRLLTLNFVEVEVRIYRDVLAARSVDRRVVNRPEVRGAPLELALRPVVRKDNLEAVRHVHLLLPLVRKYRDNLVTVVHIAVPADAKQLVLGLDLEYVLLVVGGDAAVGLLLLLQVDLVEQVVARGRTVPLLNFGIPLLDFLLLAQFVLWSAEFFGVFFEVVRFPELRKGPLPLLKGSSSLVDGR